MNLRDRDNLRAKDKRPVPKVSFFRRLDCTTTVFKLSVWGGGGGGGGKSRSAMAGIMHQYKLAHYTLLTLILRAYLIIAVSTVPVPAPVFMFSNYYVGVFTRFQVLELLKLNIAPTAILQILKTIK